MTLVDRIFKIEQKICLGDDFCLEIITKIDKVYTIKFTNWQKYTSNVKYK